MKRHSKNSNLKIVTHAIPLVLAVYIITHYRDLVVEATSLIVQSITCITGDGSKVTYLKWVL